MESKSLFGRVSHVRKGVADEGIIRHVLRITYVHRPRNMLVMLIVDTQSRFKADLNMMGSIAPMGKPPKNTIVISASVATS